MDNPDTTAERCYFRVDGGAEPTAPPTVRVDKYGSARVCVFGEPAPVELIFNMSVERLAQLVAAAQAAMAEHILDSTPSSSASGL